jgi:hypothetical protein
MRGELADLALEVVQRRRGVARRRRFTRTHVRTITRGPDGIGAHRVQPVGCAFARKRRDRLRHGRPRFRGSVGTAPEASERTGSVGICSESVGTAPALPELHLAPASAFPRKHRGAPARPADVGHFTP